MKLGNSKPQHVRVDMIVVNYDVNFLRTGFTVGHDSQAKQRRTSTPSHEEMENVLDSFVEDIQDGLEYSAKCNNFTRREELYISQEFHKSIQHHACFSASTITDRLNSTDEGKEFLRSKTAAVIQNKIKHLRKKYKENQESGKRN